MKTEIDKSGVIVEKFGVTVKDVKDIKQHPETGGVEGVR